MEKKMPIFGTFLVHLTILISCIISGSDGHVRFVQSYPRIRTIVNLASVQDYIGQFQQEEHTRIRTLVNSASIQDFISQFQQQQRVSEPYNAREQVRQPSNAQDQQTVAEEVIADLDTSVNPCDNFFQFACGGYINRTSPPSGPQFLISSTRQAALNVIRTRLKDPIRPTDPAPLQKAKMFFKSCMNEQLIEQRGVSPVLQFLSDRGGWPVLGPWDWKQFDMIGLLANIRPLIWDYEFHYQPTGAIIGTIIQRDFKRKGRYAIYIDQPSLGQYSFSSLINHEVYRLGKNNFYNQAYIDYLVDIAVLHGADVGVAKRDMVQVFEFESKLASIMLFEQERRVVSKRYNKVSILELTLRYPFIDWQRYLSKLLSVSGQSVNPHTEVVLWAAPYYDRLGKVLAETPVRTIANYILLRAVAPLLPTLGKTMQYVSLRYTATVNGVNNPQLPNRESFCTGIVSEQLSWVTSRIFIDNSDNMKQTISQASMIDRYVRSATLDLIKRANWLTNISKRKLFEKMKSLGTEIGFPSRMIDNDFLENSYKQFNYNNGFFENHMESLTENYKVVLSKLAVRPSIEWILRPGLLNALHNLGTGGTEIPLSVLAPPVFSLKYAPSMNFGGIGFLMAHEYMHGFEVTGRSFTSDGLLKMYISEQSEFNFKVKEQCLVKQYSEFFLPDVKVGTDGDKSLNENICDVEGMRIGFYAYKKFKKENKIEDRILGLPFTGDQLYFINQARPWCENSSPVFLRKFQLIDHHAINRLRVIGPIQNSKEFASAFNCPTGSLMNPKRKCTIW